MKSSFIYIGLDVDDAQYHGSALDKESGEVITFQCRPTLKGLLNQLKKLNKYFSNSSLKLCYEASYIGFTLQRDLTAKGYHCDIVAPTSIPSPRTRQIKTDRLDAAQLAQFYANDLLTVINVPEMEQEQDRDLLRSRQKIRKQQTELRLHILALLRRNGRCYRQETQHKAHWSTWHYGSLKRVTDEASGSFKINLTLLLQQLELTTTTLEAYRQEIDALANTEKYQPVVKALICYKGIKNMFALTLATEIGDIKRFPHPRKLVAYIGMDIREYSSGGKPHRFGITKQGNHYLRTAFVESNQRSYRSCKISKDVVARRKGCDPALISIADRCLRRLNKKGSRLLLAGKHPNKVKVACAREMVGFIWESMNKVAA